MTSNDIDEVKKLFNSKIQKLSTLIDNWKKQIIVIQEVDGVI